MCVFFLMIVKDKIERIVKRSTVDKKKIPLKTNNEMINREKYALSATNLFS